MSNHDKQEEQEVNLTDEFDARVWAEEFNKSLVKGGHQPFDPETMVAWFANAIMAGYDHCYRKYKVGHPHREGNKEEARLARLQAEGCEAQPTPSCTCHQGVAGCYVHNPAFWQGKVKPTPKYKCYWCKDTGRRSIGSRPSTIPCDMCEKTPKGELIEKIGLAHDCMLYARDYLNTRMKNFPDNELRKTLKAIKILDEVHSMLTKGTK